MIPNPVVGGGPVTMAYLARTVKKVVDEDGVGSRDEEASFSTRNVIPDSSWRISRTGDDRWTVEPNGL